jgi:hypothetical protein
VLELAEDRVVRLDGLLARARRANLRGGLEQVI